MPSIEEIKRLIEAATPGPWAHNSSVDPGNLWSVWSDAIRGTRVATGGRVRTGDAAFIAASRTLMPKLLAVAEALKSERNDKDDCYCDCNSGSCPCRPCQDRAKITDKALAALEAE